MAGNTEKAKQQKGRVLKGVVCSVSMKDTAVVQVVRNFKHPRYGKYVRERKKYLVHDPGNTHTVGDSVEIRESKPISKRKHFKINV